MTKSWAEFTIANPWLTVPPSVNNLTLMISNWTTGNNPFQSHSVAIGVPRISLRFMHQSIKLNKIRISWRCLRNNEPQFRLASAVVLENSPSRYTNNNSWNPLSISDSKHLNIAWPRYYLRTGGSKTTSTTATAVTITATSTTSSISNSRTKQFFSCVGGADFT